MSDARFARPHPTPTRVRKCAKCHPRLPESILRAARPQRVRTLRTHTYPHALTNSLSLSSRRSVKIHLTVLRLRHKHGPSVNTPRWSRGSSEHGRAGPASSLGMPIRRARSPTSSVPLTTTRDSSPRPTYCCRCGRRAESWQRCTRRGVAQAAVAVARARCRRASARRQGRSAAAIGCTLLDGAIAPRARARLIQSTVEYFIFNFTRRDRAAVRDTPGCVRYAMLPRPTHIVRRPRKAV